MTQEHDPCTCRNRKLTKEQAVFFIVPVPKERKFMGFATAKDCPLHGATMTVHEPDEPVSENIADPS